MEPTKVDLDLLRKKVIIVGGGMAGISCAEELHKRGFSDVTVLEASNRLGGRMHTVIHDSKPLELGAQWIHGQEGNKIYKLASEANLVDHEAPDYTEAMRQYPNSKSLEEPFLHAFDYLMSCLEDIETSEPMSLGQCVRDIYKNKSDLFGNIPVQPQIKKSFYDFFENFLCEMNGCRRTDEISANLLHKYICLDGKQTNELKLGYKAVLDLIVEKVPPEWIKLEKKVVDIIWSESDVDTTNSVSNGLVKVICEDGSIYLGNHVVLTMSVGCLKENAAAMFNPPLPEMKMKVINCIGFDVINKVYLEFDKPFWEPTTVFPAVFISDENEKPEDADLWYRYINRFAYVPHHPNMLCAWVVGNGAATMENLSVEEVQSDCMKLLQKLLKRTDLPEPSNLIRSRWFSNALARGSYSYPSVQCEKLNLTANNLAEPVCVDVQGKQHPVLLFAGEATHLQYFGTVHAAHETGLREAERLYDYYQ